MIGKQYLNPAFLDHLKYEARTFYETSVAPHLSDLNGSLLGIEQHLEEISGSLKRIANAFEKQRESSGREPEEWRRW